jgi:hypothetical protein
VVLPRYTPLSPGVAACRSSWFPRTYLPPAVYPCLLLGSLWTMRLRLRWWMWLGIVPQFLVYSGLFCTVGTWTSCMFVGCIFMLPVCVLLACLMLCLLVVGCLHLLFWLGRGHMQLSYAPGPRRTRWCCRSWLLVYLDLHQGCAVHGRVLWCIMCACSTQRCYAPGQVRCMPLWARMMHRMSPVLCHACVTSVP